MEADEQAGNRLDLGRSPHEARARRTQQGPYEFLTKTKRKKGTKEQGKKEKKERRKQEEGRKNKDRRPKTAPNKRKKRRFNRKVDPGGTIALFVAYCVLAKQKKREVLDGINTQSERVSKTADAQNIPVPKLVYDNLTHPPTISYC